MMNNLNQGNDMTRIKKENTNDDSFNPLPFDLEKLITGNQKIPLSINGLDREEEKAKLELHIQEMIRAELVKYIQSLKSNDSKDNPPDMTGGITVSLESLPIPFE